MFLAGTALALSVERRVLRGVNAWEIDRTILVRGAIIAVLDPTIVSFGSGRWTFQVLLAIGLSMMCMAALRRLPTWALLAVAAGWMVLGEIPTAWFWQPPGNSSVPAAFVLATYGKRHPVDQVPMIPWLSMMVLGWVFGRHLVRLGRERAGLGEDGSVDLRRGVPDRVRGGSRNRRLWRHVSAPGGRLVAAVAARQQVSAVAYLRHAGAGSALSLSGAAQNVEPRIGIRENGLFFVFGQTAMFFYLVTAWPWRSPPPTSVCVAPAAWVLPIVAAVLLAALYPACRWYRSVKQRIRIRF